MKHVFILVFIVNILFAQNYNHEDTSSKAKKIVSKLLDLQELGTTDGYKECLLESDKFNVWIEEKKNEGLNDSIYRKWKSFTYFTRALVYEVMNKPGDLEKTLFCLDSMKMFLQPKMKVNDFSYLNYHSIRSKVFEKQLKYDLALQSIEKEDFVIKNSFADSLQSYLSPLNILHKNDVYLKIEPLNLQKIKDNFKEVESILSEFDSKSSKYIFLEREYINVKLRYYQKVKDYDDFLKTATSFESKIKNKVDLNYFYETWINALSNKFPQNTDYQLFQKLLKIRNEIFDEKSSSEINKIRGEFDLAKKESDLKIAHLENQSANTKIYILIFVIFLIVILGAIIFRLYKKQIYLNEQLSLQKNEIEIQKEDIQKSEQDKILLLRELHHRVKNNLQMLSSMFRMQLNRLEDENAIDAIKQGQNRVNALSLLHQDLYQNDNISEVNFEQYAKELIENNVHSFQIPNFEFIYKINLPEIHIETAIPIGLILNELTTNSCKYANLENKLVIEITSYLNDKDEIVLVYCDNGNGLPQDFDFEKSTSFGIKLIRMLTMQLNGEINIENNKGVKFEFVFKKVKLWKK